MDGKISKQSKFAMSGINKKKEIPFKDGSYDPSYIYIIKMKSGIKTKGRIVDVRLLENIDKKIPKSEISYRYYMHCFGLNRRMDDWYISKDLEKTVFTLEDIKKKKEGNNLPENTIHFLETIDSSEDEGLDPKEQESHEEATKVKTISQIQIGKYTIDTWYYSPYPEGFHTYSKLYYCEFCLSFFKHSNDYTRHVINCGRVHPPGNQIYKDNNLNISMFEIDGEKSWEYCENLALLSKLYLDHKYIWYTIDTFLFYVLTEYDEFGYHIVGYFSKNKELSDPHNLSCILVLPCYQKKGYGKFLINFSYEISVKDGQIGTPERPLSDLGKLVYMRYWAQRIIKWIQTLSEYQKINLTIKNISEGTYIKDTDVVMALENIKILKKVKNQIYLCLDKDLLVNIYSKMGRPAIVVHNNNLHYIPFKPKIENFAN